MPWWEVVGWAGSVLVVVSLMQARVWRFRVMNLVGAVLATAYNAVFGIWAFAAMNGAIAVIDVYWLWRLRRERSDAAVYAVVEVASDDAYLRHVLAVHADDVARHRTVPAEVVDDALADGPHGELAFLVVRGDETVGVVLVRDEGDGTGTVLLDWVTPRFRDFTPGEFVYRDSDVFARHGLHRLVVPTAPTGAVAYLERVGFRRVDDRAWERAV
ncbi:conserved hypothetical protein [Cellulomonas flavigena DSM 20109]|uniref:N-acetyltransferase domain-containing protein n=1 Tax=Cellulomonas flavigena (strain ATCC 482 / DSM 20109 / BCRC 11376 / JCM 18109 / NBRC 3775 / NCIMB 8073 / NRS 134) TaxID=446466 RepID=D5UGF9_CELFN|nr:hypothetical protein [Cellulomonas flavigena]ADG73142.1 conserved hypothetical protein [Cellulomonas flavigena DSM 20109]